MSTVIQLDQVQGCLLGVALGDALGAPFEGGILERAMWSAIGTTWQGELRWTDDTQMTIDLVESYLRTGTIDSDDLAETFARGFRWSRGYGAGAARLLKLIAQGADWREVNRAVFPDGSFGNGAAMRSTILGVIYPHGFEPLSEAVYRSAIVTHAHPLGIEGALVIAHASQLAATGHTAEALIEAMTARGWSAEFQSRLELAQDWLAGDRSVRLTEVRQQLGNGIAAHESAVTAVYAACQFFDRPLTELLEYLAKLGGDVDTIGAMAGGIWGAGRGYAALPSALLKRLEQRERLVALATSLHRHLAEGASD